MSNEYCHIPGFEKYIIYKNGLVFNTVSKRFIKQRIDRAGYWAISLYMDGIIKTKLVHRLLAICFISNPNNKPFVNHVNSIRNDNSINNLEWCTQSENIIHGYKMGNIIAPMGEKQGSSKLKESDILLIRKSKKSQTSLAMQFNVSQSVISRIKTKDCWKHI